MNLTFLYYYLYYYHYYNIVCHCKKDNRDTFLHEIKVHYNKQNNHEY